MTTIAKCNRCYNVSDSWLHLDIEQMLGGEHITRMIDQGNVDLCVLCQSDFQLFMRRHALPAKDKATV